MSPIYWLLVLTLLAATANARRRGTRCFGCTFSGPNGGHGGSDSWLEDEDDVDEWDKSPQWGAPRGYVYRCGAIGGCGYYPSAGAGFDDDDEWDKPRRQVAPRGYEYRCFSFGCGYYPAAGAGGWD